MATRPLLAADRRGLAAALAFSAAHHPHADSDRIRDLADRCGVLTEYDAIIHHALTLAT